MTVVPSSLGAHRNSAIVKAGPYDVVDGVRADYVVKPQNSEEIVEVMREATERDEAVVARGGGTKLDWGLPPSRLDLVVDLSGMDKVLEHAAGDLIVRVEPGVGLADLQGLLAQSGQRLALDEPVAGSTIGGLVATGLCGPSRLAYGCVRDLLIGISVVRAGGEVAKSGGQVVKNVAGYDLSKLYTGSYGTLGIVSEAIFRLHPVPEAQAWVTSELSSDDELVVAMGAVTGSQIVPSAIEMNCSGQAAPVELTVLIEGLSGSVGQRSDEVARLLGGSATVSSSAPQWWAAIPGATTIKLATAVSELAELLSTVRNQALAAGLEPAIRGSAALGLIYAGLAQEAEPGAVDVFVTGVRTRCETDGGSAIVLRAPAAVKEAVDVWGSVKSIEIMRRVKDNFDPRHLLAPGRFVSGI